MSALVLVIVLSGSVCLFAWIASIVSGDYSWVDRSWSIVPVLYVWVFASYAHVANARLDLMAALVSVWVA